MFTFQQLYISIFNHRANIENITQELGISEEILNLILFRLGTTHQTFLHDFRFLAQTGEQIDIAPLLDDVFRQYPRPIAVMPQPSLNHHEHPIQTMPPTQRRRMQTIPEQVDYSRIFADESFVHETEHRTQSSSNMGDTSDLRAHTLFNSFSRQSVQQTQNSQVVVRETHILEQQEIYITNQEPTMQPIYTGNLLLGPVESTNDAQHNANVENDFDYEEFFAGSLFIDPARNVTRYNTPVINRNETGTPSTPATGSTSLGDDSNIPKIIF